MKFFLSLLFLFSTLSIQAVEYKIDYSKSQIEFSGVHAGNDFTGVFEKWNAQISINAADLKNAYIKAQFDLSSAKTGNKMYDRTLPKKDWFNIKQSSNANFESTSISKNSDGSYLVAGRLSIRDITQSVEFELTIDGSDSSVSIISTQFDMKRLDFDIGKKSDPESEWVSANIGLKVTIYTKN